MEKFIQDQETCFEVEWKLMKLCQTTSVLNYQIEFELLSRRVAKMSELLLVSCFISGLKPEIRGELQLHRPTSLKEAFTSALFHGSKLEGSKLVVNKEMEIVDSSHDHEFDSMLPSEVVIEVSVIPSALTEESIQEQEVERLNPQIELLNQDLKEEEEERVGKSDLEQANEVIRSKIEQLGEDCMLEQDKVYFDPI